MLTIPSTFREIYFLTNFFIFCKESSSILAKIGKNKDFAGLSASGLEFKLRAQRGMTFLDLTLIFFVAAKKLSFYAKKMGFRPKKPKTDFYGG